MNVSIQTCMDTIDYLKGKDQGNLAMVNSSSGEIVPCTTYHPPATVTDHHHLLPRPDQALKCPRCNSTQTKFCYYNNYSHSQPRYFCKTCRRYWTKGGSLRNVPIGGGCRKNKRSGNSGGKKPSGVDHPPFLHQYNSFDQSSFTEHTCANLHPPSHLGSLPDCSDDGGRSCYRHMQLAKFDHMPPPVGYLLSGNQKTLVQPSPVDENDTASGTSWKALLSTEWQESNCGDVRKVSSLEYCSTGTGNEYHGTNTFYI